MSSPFFDVDAIIADRQTKIMICCGAGGVGKTTTSAALALRAAEAGRKVVVLTIDPARRLAQSLGIGELGNTPRPVAGLEPTNGGSLDAMMLDMKRTFDDVVIAHAPPDKAAAVLQNPFYEALSTSFSYAGIHGDGETRSASSPGGGGWQLGLDHRRYATREIGIGFSRRARALERPPGRPLPPNVAGAHRRSATADECRLPFGVLGNDQDPRRPAPAGRAHLRHRVRGIVRRLSAASSRNARLAGLGAHDLPGRGNSATRCAARGRLLRRPVARRAHAASRNGDQPGAFQPAGDLGRTSTGHRRGPRSADCGSRDRSVTPACRARASDRSRDAAARPVLGRPTRRAENVGVDVSGRCHRSGHASTRWRPACRQGLTSTRRRRSADGATAVAPAPSSRPRRPTRCDCPALRLDIPSALDTQSTPVLPVFDQRPPETMRLPCLGIWRAESNRPDALQSCTATPLLTHPEYRAGLPRPISGTALGMV